MVTKPPEPEGLTAVDRLAEVLHEVRVGAPPSRDAAFDTLRRLLAVHTDAERLVQQPRGHLGGTWNGQAARSQRAIAASVAFLEMVRRDSLDFVIEAGLLEEILADYLAPGWDGGRAPTEEGGEVKPD